MGNHGPSRGSALIKAAVFALAAASLTLGGGAALAQATAKKAVASAKPAAKPNLAINGYWVGQNITYDSGPETNMTANLTTTPWAALSKGRPEDVKFDPVDVQRARSRAIVEANTDVFAPGRRGGGPPAPFTPAGAKAAEDLRAARAEAAKARKPTPYDRCLPTNAFALFNGNMEIFSANGHMGVLNDNSYRPIHMNATKDKYTPSYTGISIGHWEGDRLVVVTSDWLGDAVNGWPPSEDAKLTETLWIDAKGILNIKAVYEDKQHFQEPIARMSYLRRSKTVPNDQEFTPSNCVADIEGAAEFDAVFAGGGVEAGSGR